MQGRGASARGGSGAAGRLVGLEPASALFIRVKRRELAECFAALRRAALPASWSLIWPSKVQEQWRCRAAVEQWQRSATLLGKRAMALRQCRWRALQRGWSSWSSCTRLQRHRSALGVLVGEAGRCIRCRWALDAWRENLFRVPVTSMARNISKVAVTGNPMTSLAGKISKLLQTRINTYRYILVCIQYHIIMWESEYSI